jgi:hypothetical protein
VEPIYRTVSVPVRGDSCVNYDRSRPNYTSQQSPQLHKPHCDCARRRYRWRPGSPHW